MLSVQGIRRSGRVPSLHKSKDPDEIVRTIELISDSFGGINLEDISAPLLCFEIEAKLKEKLDIPVFHDDQHWDRDSRRRGYAQRRKARRKET